MEVFFSFIAKKMGLLGKGFPLWEVLSTCGNRKTIIFFKKLQLKTNSGVENALNSPGW